MKLDARDRFAVGIALLIGAIAAGLVALRGPTGAANALYIGPILLTATAFILLARLRQATVPALIHRQYLVYSRSREPPDHTALTAALDALGYQTVGVGVDDAGGELGAAAAGPITGLQLRVRDRRAPARAGQMFVRLRKQDDGTVGGLIEADDDGPGFYDEMAQLAIVELARLVDGLEWSNEGSKRWPASELEKTLPKRPLGLGILGIGSLVGFR